MSMCTAAPCPHPDFLMKGIKEISRIFPLKISQGIHYSELFFLAGKVWIVFCDSALSWRRLYVIFFLPEYVWNCWGLRRERNINVFVVLKSIPYLAKNIVKNMAVELLVVCAKVFLCWACQRSWDVCSGLIDLTQLAPVSLNDVTKLLHPYQTELYIQCVVLYFFQKHLWILKKPIKCVKNKTKLTIIHTSLNPSAQWPESLS